MLSLYEQIQRVIDLDVPVCILGETGTGKELVARALHSGGPRRKRSFQAVHCAAIPESLLESELFGHARGAYTGAVSDTPGLIEAAQGGTLLLDEVGDLSPSAQVKLLRVLQEREVRRLGERRSRDVDVRILAATHRELETEVAEGRFREDLFYRLHVVALHVPPLRTRDGDVLLLAERFLERYSQEFGLGEKALDPRAREALSRYGWPGNVRELENVVRAAVATAGKRRVVRREDMPERILGSRAPMTLREALQRHERERVEEALHATGGNRTRAARQLGISRQALLRKLRTLGIG
jgi:DNA-binding NtrC family response regulator